MSLVQTLMDPRVTKGDTRSSVQTIKQLNICMCPAKLKSGTSRFGISGFRIAF